MLLSVLNFSPSQQFLTSCIADALSAKIGTPVSIESIQVGLFNRVILNEVSIEDQQGKHLLEAKRAMVKIELRSLLKEQLNLRTISLLDADIRIYKETPQGPTNLQFILDAFSKPKKEEKSSLNLRINSLILRRINVSYDELYKECTPNRFNTGHIQLNQITTNISVKALTPDSLKLYVRALSFDESSGFVLEKGHLAITANRQGATIQKLDVTLPHSHIRQEKLVATYDARKGWDQLPKTIRFEGQIDNTHLDSQDFRAFHPLLEKIHLSSDFAADFIISPQQIDIPRLTLQEDEQQLDIHLQALLNRQDGKVTGIGTKIEKIRIQSKLAQDIVGFFKPDTTLHHLIEQLGSLDIHGEGHYQLADDEGTAHLQVGTQAGMFRIQSQWKDSLLTNRFNVQNLALADLLPYRNIPTQISLNGQAQLAFANRKLHTGNGQVELERFTWNDYEYQHVSLQSKYAPDHISVQLESPDSLARLNLQAEARLHNGKLTQAALKACIDQLTPQKLGWKTPYGEASFKGEVSAQLQNLTTDPTGSFSLHQFSMTDSPRGDYHLEHFETSLQNHQGAQKLLVRSDFLSASVEGSRPFKHFLHDAEAIVRRCLPGLLPVETVTPRPESVWKIQAQLKRNDIFDKLLRTPFNFNEDLNIKGTIDTGDGKSSLYVFTDGFQAGKQQFKQSSLFLQGQGDNYECLVKSKTYVAKKDFECSAEFNTKDSCLISQIVWHADTEKNYDGRFKCSTQFWNQNRNLDYNVKIQPTQFTLADSVWQIAPGEIASINRELSVKQFQISHADQALKINGGLSPYRNDSILAHLNKINIEYILGLINFDAVSFGGKASGLVTLDQTLDAPEVHARLDVPDFTFNHGNMGHAHILGNWNKRDNRINLDAQMDLPQGHGAGTHVDGYVSLAEKGLDLKIQANQTDLRFLRRYMDGIFDEFGGQATGFVNLYGPFKKLDFKGELKADAEAKIVATGVKYKVTDGDVVLSPGEFAFNNFTVKDDFKGKGKANGYLRHNHLKHLTYKFEVTADHLLCYDMPQTDDLPFYSTATGSGNVQLEGYPGNFIGNITLRPESPTKLVYIQGTPGTTSADDQMIRFHTAKDDRQTITIPDSMLRHSVPASPQTEEEAPEATTNIILNFLIDTNPSAELKIITDPRAGDAITAYGRGPIRAKFNNKGNFEMYGTYKLDRGSYKLSLQDVIRKDLKLRNDSKMTFSGNPQKAELGLNAIYSINGVSLSDLNYSAGFSEKSVNVDCILNIRGTADAPKVNFDLDLHNISEDEKQMVRQLIATDEDMNRQVIYLLGIGRFYATNPQIASGQNNAQDPSSAAMKSFLSTTITSQLNNAISSAMGNESHWSFGTNVAPGVLGWEDVEVDGLLQGRLLNDRLLINGNFGYRDRPTYTSNFVGDFDIKYILTPKGGVSLKAYSETTDRYFTKSALTTQGVGISLQRDFKRFKELFQVKKRRQQRKAKRAENRKAKAEAVTGKE